MDLVNSQFEATAVRRGAQELAENARSLAQIATTLDSTYAQDINEKYLNIATAAFSKLDPMLKSVGNLSPTLLKIPPYVKKRHNDRTIRLQMSFLEPEHVTAMQTIARGAWNNMVFLRGHGKKEGSKLYPVRLFVRADGQAEYAQIVLEHEDCFKAAQLFKMANLNFAADPKESLYEFCTSAGFSDVVLGLGKNPGQGDVQQGVKAPM